jgi:16S rRNA G1207 methylase RsmC
MPTKRFKEQLVDWQVLHDNLAPRLTDMPQLAADHTALAQVLTQALDLENKQEAARAVLRDVNQQRRQMKTQGRSLQRRLTLGLKATLGEQNEKLIEFAVKPRQRQFPRQQRSAAEKAARAAARAAAKAAAAKAAEKAAEPPPTPTPTTA